MKLEVYNISGDATGRSVELDERVFGLEANDHAVWLDVKRIQANARQGTHKAKERAEITGSTKKLRKQKGSGAARIGSIKNPLFKGGGRVFGPKPRNYSLKVNKKVSALARRSALSYKAKSEALRVVENFSLDAPKTKDYKKILESLNVIDKKNLLVIHELDSNVILSARNLKKASVDTVERINTLEIMQSQVLLLTEASVEVLNNSVN